MHWAVLHLVIKHLVKDSLNGFMWFLSKLQWTPPAEEPLNNGLHGIPYITQLSKILQLGKTIMVLQSFDVA
jgi:hypothetical protein